MRMTARIVLFVLLVGLALSLPAHAGGIYFSVGTYRGPHNGGHLAPCYINGCYEQQWQAPPVVVVRPPRVVFGAPRVIFGAPPVTVVEDPTVVQSAPQQAQSQWSPVQNFSAGPDMNIDLRKIKRTIHHDQHGREYAPSDLLSGGAAIICNAPSGNYKLPSESMYNGTQYHKQQCWLFWYPVGGSPQEREIPAD